MWLKLMWLVDKKKRFIISSNGSNSDWPSLDGCKSRWISEVTEFKQKKNTEIISIDNDWIFYVSIYSQYAIKNKRLFRKCITILAFIILLFFVETIPTIQRLSLGWYVTRLDLFSLSHQPFVNDLFCIRCAFVGVVLLLAITEYVSPSNNAGFMTGN